MSGKYVWFYVKDQKKVYITLQLFRVDYFTPNYKTGFSYPLNFSKPVK
jgi:hypothetical protein